MHQKYMRRCFELAQKGLGYTAPNPMVGAVIVYNDTIIGEGWHQAFGKPHAEVNAIASVAAQHKHLLAEATLYVSLEPCAHFGKTPPCANLIIQHKIPKVVIGCKDPFAQVNGQGIALLKNAGIEVICGILEEEAHFLIRRFIVFHTQKRPYIILKWAQSADNFIGKHHEKIPISNALSQQYSHQWRSEEAAILVGENTIITDNPTLTVRHWQGRNPVRIALQKRRAFLPQWNIFNLEAKTILFSTLKNQEIPASHTKVELPPDVQDFIPFIVEYLYKAQINSVIIEGGASVLNAFLAQNLWDEARIIKSNNVVLKQGIAAPVLQQVACTTAVLGNDLVSFYYNR